MLVIINNKLLIALSLIAGQALAMEITIEKGQEVELEVRFIPL